MVANLLSTVKCKNSDLSEENIFRRVNIEFFSCPSVDFMLNFANERIRQVREVVPLGICFRISLFAFSIAPFCHEEYESAKNTKLPACLPLGTKVFEIS